MVMAVIIAIIVVLILAIWFFLEFKRARHKFFAIFLILLVLFLFFSVTLVFKGKNIDYKTVPGLISAGGVYVSWLGTAFNNIKIMTSDAIHMNWGGNSTSVK